MINIHNFQKLAVVAVEKELTDHFMRQGEQVEEFLSADYSLDPIEIGVKTHKDSHYVELLSIVVYEKIRRRSDFLLYH